MTPLLRTKLAAASAMLALAAVASAQDYPNKPVRIIVSYAPGGAPDIVARVLAQHLTGQLGQPFVVENRAGSGGTIGAAQVARSPADGYTVLLGGASELVIAPATIKGVPYDSIRSFTPVGLVAMTPLIIVVSAKATQIKNLQDLIREARNNPGKWDYGTPGIGTMHHLAMEVFAADAGVKMNHIPYKGGSQMTTALLAGEVPILMTSFPSVSAHIQSGALRVLGVTSATRYPPSPDTPSISESVKGYHFASEMGVVAPSGTPPAVISRLSRALQAAVADANVQTRFANSNLVPFWSTPEAYGEGIRNSVDRFQRAVKLANLQPQ